MESNIQALLRDVMSREGYTVNHSADRGGPTYRGVTLEVARKRWPGITFEGLRQKSDEDILDFYYDEYVVGPRFHYIDDAKLRAFVVDYGINSGPAAAVQAIQVAINIDDKVNRLPDVLGPRTLAALRSSNPAVVLRAVFLLRWTRYDQLTLHNAATRAFIDACVHRPAAVAAFLGVPVDAAQHNDLVFAEGWNNRLRGQLP